MLAAAGLEGAIAGIPRPERENSEGETYRLYCLDYLLNAYG